MRPGTSGPAIIRAIHDEGYTRRRHTRGGSQVARELRRGRDAHVFNDDVDLRELEAKVWTEGMWLGTAGSGERAKFDRFVWRSPAPIGRRIQAGRQDVPLSWVEIKGKMVGGAWVYHLAPRARPAS